MAEPVTECCPEETSTAGEAEIEDGQDDSNRKKNPHKHDSGAADLEKVTDYAEEKEISSISKSAAQLITAEQQGDGNKSKAEKELSKIIIRKEDVELIMHEMEVNKAVAERKLRESRGNVKEALRALIMS